MLRSLLAACRRWRLRFTRAAGDRFSYPHEHVTPEDVQ